MYLCSSFCAWFLLAFSTYFIFIVKIVNNKKYLSLEHMIKLEYLISICENEIGEIKAKNGAKVIK